MVQFTVSLTFWEIYLYAWSVSNSEMSSWILVMMFGSTLSAIDEALPKHQQYTAGILRATAVSVSLCLLATTVFTPEVVAG